MFALLLHRDFYSSLKKGNILTWLAIMLNPLFCNIQLEATVVGMVTIVFLALFIVAGIRQKLKDKE